MAAIFTLVFASMAFGSSTLIIKNPQNIVIEADVLKSRFNTAYALFSKVLGPVDQAITIIIADESCLRTGYNFVLNRVNFCGSRNIHNHGLDSIDVFNHEIFHALLCNYSKKLCGPDMKADLHEGLADYFSYLLNPDETFGENYYKEYPYIRKYLTTFRLGLVQKEHERGNVFATQFIQSKMAFRDALKLFDQDLSGEEVKEVITGVAYSRLNRYRLTSSDVMGLTFVFAKETNVVRVDWEIEDSFPIKGLDPLSFEISIPGPLKSPKAMASFINDKEETVGQRMYYFGSKKLSEED